MKTKQCFMCKEFKSFDDFHRRSNGQLHSYCNICRATNQRNYRLIQSEKPAVREYNRKRQLISRQINKNARISTIYTTLLFNAKRRDIECTLTKELLWTLFEIQGWKCYKTGIPFDLTTGKGKRPFGPSVDRKNSSKGYHIDNIQIVCNIYNFAKNQFDENDVLLFAQSLIANHKQGS